MLNKILTCFAGLLLTVSVNLQGGEPIVFGTKIDAAAQILASRELAATVELKDQRRSSTHPSGPQ